MPRPEWGGYRIADLFCGVGGASGGLARAFPGAHIVGVDNRPQPNYPFEFVQGNALTFSLDGFDFVHASPPCQGSTNLRFIHPENVYPELIAPTRERLWDSGLPFIIENVPRAPLNDPVGLCGSMFDLPIRRHRWFETSFPVDQPKCRHDLQTFDWRPYLPIGCAQKTRNKGPIYVIPIYGHAASWVSHLWSWALQIPWAKTAPELAQAIPPAYTEYVAQQYLASLED